MYNPHAEILERFERVETLINHLISAGSSANTTPVNAQPPATRQLAADHLGVSLPTLDKLINSRQLKAFNIGRQVRIKWDEIQEYVNKKGAANK
jgi:excisionase family DNA binding protein